MTTDPFTVQDPELAQHLQQRHRTSRLWKYVFFFSICIGLIALSTLLWTVINQSFGYIAEVNKVEPSALVARPLEQLSETELADILCQRLTRLRLRALEREKPLDQRTQADLLNLTYEQIVQPKIVATWTLYESLFRKESIQAEVNERFPGADLTFRAWLNLPFLQNSMSSQARLAGVRTALLGSIHIILITILFAFPIGVGAAIYLEEYADRRYWFNRIIQTNIENLAGVPSIVYGILGLAIFVRALSGLTSGAWFGTPTDNGRTILSAGLTMGLLILPILIITAQEAVRAVPNSLRQAAYGLGATQWQTIWHHVLPAAMPGILTGTILSISRAMGETAPLVVVGASTYITADPSGPFSKFTTLPIQIYQWTSRPQDEFHSLAAAAIIVLLFVLLSLNAAAILLRNRFSRTQNG